MVDFDLGVFLLQCMGAADPLDQRGCALHAFGIGQYSCAMMQESIHVAVVVARAMTVYNHP